MAFKCVTAVYLIFLYCTFSSYSLDDQLLERLEELELEQLKLREGIRVQKEKNENLLKSLDEERGRHERFALDRRASNHTTHAGQLAHPCTSAPIIGFHARLTGGTHVLSTGNIVFDLVETNVGGGYNNTSGIFTVPYAGKYEFILTLMSRSGTSYDARITRNNATELCRAHASTQSQAMGACVTMVELNRGDIVSVVPYSGSQLHGGKYTSLSGHIINS